MKFLSAQAPENRGFFVLVENILKKCLQVWIECINLHTSKQDKHILE